MAISETKHIMYVLQSFGELRFQLTSDAGLVWLVSRQ